MILDIIQRKSEKITLIYLLLVEFFSIL